MKRTRLKKDKVIIILGICLLLLIIFLVVLLSDYNTDTEAIYGDRLDGISEVKITNSKKEDINENIKTTGLVDSVNTKLQGKIINIEILVKKETSREDAKTLTEKVLEKLSEEEKKFYDIQLFIDKKDDETFPIIGYRHHNKEAFSWTLDR